MLFSTACFAAASPPEGWVEVPAPEPESDAHRCANYSSEWIVSLTSQGELSIASENEPRKHTASTVMLPANFKMLKEMRGSRSVFKIKNGWLLGFDAGEWGGSLWFVSPDGQSRNLANNNIQGFIQTQDGVLVFSGLAHMGMDEGRIFVVPNIFDNHTKLETVIRLDGAPSAFTQTDSGDVLVVTTKGISQVNDKGSSKYLLQSYIGDLYPSSLIVTRNKTIYVGMRMSIVSLSRTSAGYEAHWLVPANCKHFGIQDLECVCKK